MREILYMTQIDIDRLNLVRKYAEKLFTLFSFFALFNNPDKRITKQEEFVCVKTVSLLLQNSSVPYILARSYIMCVWIGLWKLPNKV